MNLRRGFKSEANQIAREIRAEMGLRYSDPINAFDLAAHLEIPILPISALRHDVPSAIKHFESQGKSEFSAATIFSGPQRLILHNDNHAPGRQSSNIAHEISHGLLQHPRMAPLNELGCRNWDKTIEFEADWLAGALLISDEAALRIVRENMALKAAAKVYGVTEQMVRFRLNITAASRRMKAKTIASGAKALL